MNTSTKLRVQVASALEKVTPEWHPRAGELHLSTWGASPVSFQVAWLPPEVENRAPLENLRLSVDALGAEAPGSQSPSVQVYAVDLVSVQVPGWPKMDDGFMTHTPALLPDILRPLPGAEVELHTAHVGWHSVWVDVWGPAAAVRVRVTSSGVVHHEETIEIERVDAELPAHGVQYTQWFHADCLAAHYRVPMYSEQHWEIIAAHVKAAQQMGVTMLLTPVWTPPLDTAVGTYRPSTQLLDIEYRDGRYTFGTSRLDRWMDILEDAGIHEVEVPHLFTQWGAGRTPRFEIMSDGVLQQRWGWDTEATDPQYVEFLAQLVPWVKEYFFTRVGRKNTVFHISDEPSAQHRDSYRAAWKVAGPLLEDARVIDALSHPEFSELVKEPVVATDAVPAFRAHGREPAWVYYCMAQPTGVSNRFIAQWPVRTRALGWQLYKAGATGFLHWGFNFYFTQLSRGLVDPFFDTSAGGAFPGGDAFIVYPGPDGQVWPSLRHRYMRDAFADLAAARGAEQILGREAVLRIIDPEGTLDYAAGWVSGDEWLRRRYALDQAVREAQATPETAQSGE